MVARREVTGKKTVEKLLVTRAHAAEILDVSVDQIKRFEDQGLLTPRRLNRRSRVGKVHLDIAEVKALARGDER